MFLSRLYSRTPYTRSFTTSALSKVDWVKVKSAVERCGFAKVEMRDHSRETLQTVAAIFGARQKHVRNGEDGIVDIVSDTSPTSKGQVISTMEFFPHTDGHYLGGVMRNSDGSFLSVSPPQLILLQCVQPADQGGTTILVDAQKILRAIVDRDKALLKPLFFPERTSIIRGDHVVMDSPIFRRMANRRYAVRFSYDRDFIVHPQMQKVYERFNNQYINNATFSSDHNLKKNQILIIDNQRMLHGRTTVMGQRHLRRLWICDPMHTHQMVAPPGNIYYESEKTADPLAKFALYGPIDGELQLAKKPALTAGIALNKKTNRSLLNHLFCHLACKPSKMLTVNAD